MSVLSLGIISAYPSPVIVTIVVLVLYPIPLLTKVGCAKTPSPNLTSIWASVVALLSISWIIGTEV